MNNEISNTLISNNGHLTREAAKRNSFFTRGYRAAGKHSGAVSSYRITLESILWKLIHNNTLKNEDAEENNHLRDEEKTRLSEEISIKNDSLAAAENKTEELEKEISTIAAEKESIKKSPEDFAGRKSDRFWLNVYKAVIAALIVYLYFFYTSVVFSAIFRVVNIAKDTVFNSIFYPRAISESFSLGFTAAVVTLFSPSIFIAVAVLMHRISVKSGSKNRVWVAFLTLIVFSLDALLAYHISERLHNAKMLNSFEKIAGYSPATALNDPNFWLIIFFGFVVYIILGFMLSLFDEERDMDIRINRLLDNCDNRIAAAEAKRKNVLAETDSIRKEIENLRMELTSLLKENRMVTYSPAELKLKISDFTLGWMQYLKNGSFGDAAVAEVENDFREFIKSKGLENA
ncbi:MAG: hypothetical protein GX452_13360 [Ignavibacteriales bacterium]|jgi:peptidoglycan hydrolase CwlO-like protein|nr:hypothetical protein [Ignavibacteriaceae bacterium]NLH62382.1 hypothetical protein [Ignavibacteriales bacterium]